MGNDVRLYKKARAEQRGKLRVAGSARRLVSRSSYCEIAADVRLVLTAEGKSDIACNSSLILAKWYMQP